jgi:hypothetical protein
MNAIEDNKSGLRLGFGKPPKGELASRPVWLGYKSAAARMGVARHALEKWLEAGTFPGEWAPESGSAGAVYIWWVRIADVEEYVTRRGDHERPARYEHVARAAPVVRYGLLTAADVAELDRRRAKLPVGHALGSIAA